MIALLLSVQTYSQSKFSLGITQDVKLALVTDDYGNDPFTLDAVAKFSYYLGNDLNYNDVVIYIQHERAELAGGLYLRTAAGAGYSFNLKYVKLITSLNWGRIYRFDEAYDSMEAQVEVEYPFTRNLSALMLYNYTNRSDIGLWRSNLGLGIKYVFRISSKNTQGDRTQERMWQRQQEWKVKKKYTKRKK